MIDGWAWRRLPAVQPQPYWLPADTDLLLALQAEEDGKCPRGHHWDESAVDGDERAWEGEPVSCHACAAIDRAQNVFNAQEHADNAGLYWLAEKKDGSE